VSAGLGGQFAADPLWPARSMASACVCVNPDAQFDLGLEMMAYGIDATLT
jgi:hypothetical protein